MVRSSSLPKRLAFCISVAFGLAGCSSGGGSPNGCTKDTDCKGDRVCASGQCVEQPSKAAADMPGAQLNPPSTPQPIQQPNQQPNQQPQTPFPAANPEPQPGAYANDGLPVDIPPPGSSPPTIAEWNAVPREVTVRGSTRLNCETKMLREWLRATCRQNFKGHPIDVYHSEQSGQQAFKFTGSDRTSIVVQVVRGRTYKASYVWDQGGNHTGADLVVTWPGGAPRPSMYFQEQ